MKVLVAVDGSAGSFEAVDQMGRVLGERDEIALYCSPPGVRDKSMSWSTTPLYLAMGSTFKK